MNGGQPGRSESMTRDQSIHMGVAQEWMGADRVARLGRTCATGSSVIVA
jgi:hypothetical protein